MAWTTDYKTQPEGPYQILEIGFSVYLLHNLEEEIDFLFFGNLLAVIFKLSSKERVKILPMHLNIHLFCLVGILISIIYYG